MYTGEGHEKNYYVIIFEDGKFVPKEAESLTFSYENPKLNKTQSLSLIGLDN